MMRDKPMTLLLLVVAILTGIYLRQRSLHREPTVVVTDSPREGVTNIWRVPASEVTAPKLSSP